MSQFQRNLGNIPANGMQNANSQQFNPNMGMGRMNNPALMNSVSTYQYCFPNFSLTKEFLQSKIPFNPNQAQFPQSMNQQNQIDQQFPLQRRPNPNVPQNEWEQFFSQTSNTPQTNQINYVSNPMNNNAPLSRNTGDNEMRQMLAKTVINRESFMQQQQHQQNDGSFRFQQGNALEPQQSFMPRQQNLAGPVSQHQFQAAVPRPQFNQLPNVSLFFLKKK